MQALTFFYVWLLISTLFVAKTGWDSPTFVQYLALGLVFVAVKLFPNRRMIAYTLVGVGVAQAVVTVGQQLSLIESNHPYFSVTGFFGNPGPMGGFQAVTLVLAVTLMEDNPLCKWLQKGLWFAVLLIGYSVWCSNSRASWIAVIIGVSVLFYPPLFQWFKNRKWWSLRRCFRMLARIHSIVPLSPVFCGCQSVDSKSQCRHNNRCSLCRTWSRSVQ